MINGMDENDVQEVLRWYRDKDERCLVSCAPRIGAGMGRVAELGKGYVVVDDGASQMHIPLRMVTRVEPYDEDAPANAPRWGRVVVAKTDAERGRAFLERLRTADRNQDDWATASAVIYDVLETWADPALVPDHMTAALGRVLREET